MQDADRPVNRPPDHRVGSTAPSRASGGPRYSSLATPSRPSTTLTTRGCS
jgi:hypothetical protein